MHIPSLDTLRFFLLDMDGTLYLGPDPIIGAAEFIAYLRSSGRKFLYFTNNPSGDAAQYAAKLCKMGIESHPEEILTAGEATARFLVQETAYRRIFVLGTPTFEEELRRNGLQPVQEKPDAVVLSFDKTLDYAKLEAAALFLQAGLPYIATNPDKVCPTDYGDIPDCGSIAALLEAATGRAPRYIGKPNPAMARLGMARIGADPGQTAMVGDRLYTDIEMAFLAGVTAVLVLSGETRPDHLQGAPRRPHYVFDSVAGLTKHLRELDAR